MNQADVSALERNMEINPKEVKEGKGNKEGLPIWADITPAPGGDRLNPGSILEEIRCLDSEQPPDQEQRRGGQTEGRAGAHPHNPGRCQNGRAGLAGDGGHWAGVL